MFKSAAFKKWQKGNEVGAKCASLGREFHSQAMTAEKAASLIPAIRLCYRLEAEKALTDDRS